MAPTIFAPRPVFFKWGEKNNSLKREKRFGTVTGKELPESWYTLAVATPFCYFYAYWIAFQCPAGPRLYVWAPFKCSVSHRNPRVAVAPGSFGCSTQCALWMSPFPPFTSRNSSPRDKLLASFRVVSLPAAVSLSKLRRSSLHSTTALSESPPLVLLRHFRFEATALQQLRVRLIKSIIQYL